MNLRVSRTGVVALLVFLGLAVVLFVFLMGRFGGPSIGGGADYQLHATFPDSQGLAQKSDVLIRGVKVGEVGAIDIRRDRARVRLDIEGRYAPIDRAATVRVGQKTVLGEAFVDVVPGSSRAGTLRDGARIARSQVRPGVELDEALDALDDRSMKSLRSLAETFGRGARDPATPRRVSATVGELAALTRQLRGLTATLKGQESTIAATIQDSRTVLGELGRREASVSAIASAGRATLGAVASRDAALDAGLRELPKLLSTAEATLSEARPLLVEARPLVRDLSAAAPALTPALDDLRPVARDAAQVLKGLPRLRTAALPVLDRAEGVIEVARPAARGLEPALANLVPMVQYLAPRKRTLAAWFSQTAALGAHGDAKGKWARFNMFVDPSTAFGVPGGVDGNSYTPPDDGDANQAYVPGSYPRLTPFKP
jgi:phospholipid/cholesterol/gamma-HCH transport system substrate-binding protein